MSKKRGLGRNLDALLGGTVTPNTVTTNTETSQTLSEIPINRIVRGQYQPRQHIDPKPLQELTESIKKEGIVQPILLRSIGVDRYEIVAGERRWQAAQRAGLKTVPAVVKEMSDQKALAVALIENIQRQNLNSIEEAKALQRLKEEFDLTDQEAAEAVGRQRSSVTNLLRLLGLNEKVQTLLQQDRLSMGHARALLGLSREKQFAVAMAVIEQNLSVRQTEQLVQRYSLPTTMTKASNTVTKDPNVVQLERKLSMQLGTPVTIQANNKGRGKLVIPFRTLAQLQGVLDQIAAEEVE